MSAIGDSSDDPTSQGAQASPGDAAETIKEEGRRLVHRAQDSADAVARQQVGAAAAFLEDLASAIHRGAEELKNKGHPDTASFVDWTADEVGSLAGGLSSRPPADILGDVEDFARRQPALVAGAAFLIGFGLLRFMKSSSGGATASRGSSAYAGR